MGGQRDDRDRAAAAMPEHFRRERRAVLAALERLFAEELAACHGSLVLDFDAAGTWGRWDSGPREAGAAASLAGSNPPSGCRGASRRRR